MGGVSDMFSSGSRRNGVLLEGAVVVVVVFLEGKSRQNVKSVLQDVVTIKAL